MTSHGARGRSTTCTTIRRSAHTVLSLIFDFIAGETSSQTNPSTTKDRDFASSAVAEFVKVASTRLEETTGKVELEELLDVLEEFELGSGGDKSGDDRLDRGVGGEGVQVREKVVSEGCGGGTGRR